MYFRLNTNKELYNNLKQVLVNDDKQLMTEEDRYVGELFLFDFELNGIHLEERKRQYVVELNNYILVTGQQFMVATEKPRIVNKAEFPDILSKAYNINLNVQLVR